MLNHILVLGLVSYNFCMIPLACAWNFGSTNLKFSKTHCKSAFPELLHPKSRVQTSGIIQKLYETKPDAYMSQKLYAHQSARENVTFFSDF